MDVRDFVIEAMEINRAELLEVVRDLTDDEYRWMDNPNPICFLLLHIARTEDRFANRWIRPGLQIWQTEGWAERTGLHPSEAAREAGNSWTWEEVTRFDYPSIESMLEYMANVRESSIEAIRSLDLTRLAAIPRPAVPTWSVANYLQRAIHHEARHLGNVEYARGVWQMHLSG